MLTTTSAWNVTAKVDQLGRRTTVSYDKLNRQVEVKDALGNLATTVFDDAGNVTVRVDQLAHRATFTYDALNRVTARNDFGKSRRRRSTRPATCRA